jgi:hypothetical protein
LFFWFSTYNGQKFSTLDLEQGRMLSERVSESSLQTCQTQPSFNGQATKFGL